MASTSQTETKIDLFTTGEANTQKYALRQERQRRTSYKVRMTDSKFSGQRLFSVKSGAAVRKGVLQITIRIFENGGKHKK